MLKLSCFIGTIANAMTWEEFLALINAQLLKKGITPAQASRLAVGNPYLIYNIRKGRKPSFDNLKALCRVLELDFIGPPRPPASSLFNRGLNKDAPPPDSALAPVADRDLAEILALLADEYEALNDHGRRQLAARFRAAFPELRGGRRYDALSGTSDGT